MPVLPKTRDEQTKLSFTLRAAIYILLFLLSAALTELILSVSTSPLYSDYCRDSAMFQTIGKYWTEGYLPYVDLFDHKGPLIFFIDALGYAIGGKAGLFALQVVFFAGAEFAAYRLLRCRLPRAASLVFALLLPFFLMPVWEEGNMIEEYSLLPLFVAFFCMYRWCIGLERGEFVHPPRFAFIYGLFFAFSFLTRLSNALPVCVAVLFIAAVLLAKKEYKNLLWNALGFIGGATVLIIPFVIYFAVHGALYDMWYGTVVFNLSYTNASHTVAAGLHDLLAALRRYFFGWCLVAVSAVALLTGRKPRLAYWFYLSVALTSTLFLHTLYPNDHYGMLLVPCFYIALSELCTFSNAPEYGRAARALAACMLAVAAVSSCVKFYREHIQTPEPYETYIEDYHDLIKLVPDDGRESFIAFDCPRRMYLDEDIRPAFRFFVLQRWMIVNNPSLADIMRSEFAESGIEWVLTMEYPPVQDILDAEYDLIARTPYGLYSLYHLK